MTTKNNVNLVRRIIDEYATLRSATPIVASEAKLKAVTAAEEGRSLAYSLGVGFRHVIEAEREQEL